MNDYWWPDCCRCLAAFAAGKMTDEGGAQLTTWSAVEDLVYGARQRARDADGNECQLQARTIQGGDAVCLGHVREGG